MASVSLTSTCIRCGAALVRGALHCHRCGVSLGGGEAEPSGRRSSQARPRSERRYVTVLFADVVGFTELSERLEPEQVTELLDVLFERLTRIVVAKGGTIDKYIGDCVMALFGAPRAHGDDAERACAAAIAMQTACEEISNSFAERLGAEVRLRIGINGGHVIAGFIGGEGFRSYTVIGDAVNVAQRIESKAEAGGIFLSDATARLVAERFMVESVGDIQLKGRREPIAVHRLVREEVRSTAGRVFEGREIPFLHRVAEIERLRALRKTAQREGRVQVAVVTGPAAVGKSRLLEEFARELEADPATQVLVVRGREGRSAIHEALRDALAARLAAERGSWEAAVDVYAKSFGDALGEQNAETGEVARTILHAYFAGRMLEVDDEPATSRAAVFWAVGLLLRAMADTRPLAIVAVDDEFLDEGLRELALYLARRGAGALLLALEERSARSTDPLLTRIDLAPLGDDAIARMTEFVLHPAPAEFTWVPAWIAARASGNVSIALQYLRLLKQRGFVTRDPSGLWVIAEHEPAEGLVPATVEATFQAMLDAHGSVERDILRRASVFGSVFWDEILVEICEDLALRDVVLARLQELRLQGLVAPAHDDAFDGARGYRFVSREFQETCYRSLTARDSRALHASIARALDQRGLRVKNPTLVADHLLETDDVHGAGVVSLDVVDDRIANLALTPARGLLDRLEAMVQRVGIAVSPLLRARLELSRADVERVGGQFEAALAHLDRADLWLGQHMSRLSLPPVADHHRFRATSTRARVLQSLGRHAEAVQMFTQATAIASRFEDDERLVITEASLAWNLLKSGDPVRARAICERVVRAYPPQGERRTELSIGIARHFDTLGELARLEGKLDEARGFYLEALRLRAPTGRVHLIAHSEGNLAIVRAMAGDWSGAADAFRRVLGLWTGLGEEEYSCIARLNYAEALLEIGYRDEARREVRKALASAERMGAASLVDYGKALAARID
jgi:class 3 adenylate cyclase/tetratricopeptide (TPR) repeat protein